MKFFLPCFILLLPLSPLVAQEGKLHVLKQRASVIDFRAKEHPEINFLFADAKGKPLDLQHAVVDTRVPS